LNTIGKKRKSCRIEISIFQPTWVGLVVWVETLEYALPRVLGGLV